MRVVSICAVCIFMVCASITYSSIESESQQINVEAYQKARDSFFETLISSVDHNELINVLATKGNNPQVKDGIYATYLAQFLSAKTINETQKKAIDHAAIIMQHVALVYHDVKVHTKPVMVLQLVERAAKYASTLLYYPTKSLTTGEKIYKGVLCDGASCNFYDYSQSEVDGLKNTTKIKLVFKYKASSKDKSETLSHEKVQLTGLKLNETGEWFGNAEIVVALHFYKGDKFLQEHTVFLPWAIKKGLNRNVKDQPFFSWPKDATKAVAVIIEDDSDTSHFTTLKKIANAVKVFGAVGEALSKLAQSIIEQVEDWVVQDDYIGTAIFERNNPLPEIDTKEGTATFYIKSDDQY